MEFCNGFTYYKMYFVLQLNDEGLRGKPIGISLQS